MKLKKGETVYTILRHVSKSGMLRAIDMVVIRNNEPINILTFLSEEQREQFLKSYPHDKTWYTAIRVSGCGMDMGFKVVNSLSHTLKTELNQRWL